MNLRPLLLASAVLLSPMAFAQGPITADPYFQVRYAANVGPTSNVDSYVNLTNTNASGGNLCVNVYTFSPDEQEISCCSCLVTPNGLVSLSVKNDLISNTLTPAIPNSVVIKLIGSAPATGNVCDASTVALEAQMTGMLAWGSTSHAATVGGTPAFVVETPFTPATLSAVDFSRITALCGFIKSNGSGYGICKSCRPGALGAAQK